MLAVKNEEFQKFGCPNCGCNYFITDHAYIANEPTGHCKNCDLHFKIIADNLLVINQKYRTGRFDDNGKEILDPYIIIRHPRIGMPKWNWVAPDIRPDCGGEYCTPRPLGYDLACFIKSKQAGERILDMVKKVLNVENPESWLDFRPSEPTWIQFKFQESEFKLEELSLRIKEEGNIVTEEILHVCKIKEEINE